MSRKDDDAASTRRGRPRDPRVDEAILDAALTLFARSGLDGTTFEGVAAEAGVSRSAVYRRWSSREALLSAALIRHRATAERGAEDWASASSIADVMAVFADLAVQALTDPRSLGLLAQVQALDQRNPLKQAYWETIVEPRRRTFTRMILAARRRGELGDGPDPEVIQDLLAGALSHRALQHPEPLDEPGARRYVERLLDALGLPIGRSGERRDP